MSSWSRSLRAMAILALATAGAVALALVRFAGDPTPQALAATTHHSHAAVAAKVVRVSVREWRVTPSTRAVSAGPTTFVVTNRGRLPHEFLLVRARGANAKAFHLDRAHDLAVLPRIAARIPPIAPGATRRITVNLRAGRWVLMCNIKGHYRLGHVPVLRASAERARPATAPAAAAPAAGAGPTIKASTTLQLGTAGIMKFDKATLTAPEGKVTIVLTNKEVLPHNVGIKGGGVDVKSPARDRARRRPSRRTSPRAPTRSTAWCRATRARA